MEIGAIPEGAAAAFNYRLDKVRFLAPVKAGARVRLRVALMEVEEKGGGLVMKTKNTLEIEGSDTPALIAESLRLVIRSKGLDWGSRPSRLAKSGCKGLIDFKPHAPKLRALFGNVSRAGRSGRSGLEALNFSTIVMITSRPVVRCQGRSQALVRALEW